LPKGADPKAPNELLLVAAAQNKNRLEQANLEDQAMLGETKKHHLSSAPNYFLPDPMIGPDNNFWPPAWFVKEITIVAATPSPAPSKSSIQFDGSGHT
jgi:hypothetical protein